MTVREIVAISLATQTGDCKILELYRNILKLNGYIQISESLILYIILEMNRCPGASLF